MRAKLGTQHVASAVEQGRTLQWGEVRCGLRVRLIDDVQELERLCLNAAPGAIARVGWDADMAQYAGQVVTINDRDIDDTYFSLQFEDCEFSWPFTAFRHLGS